jgi:glycogen synthase
VISNSGVGDVEEIIKNADAGFVVHEFTGKEFEEAVASIPHLLQKQPEQIRKAVEPVFSLDRGIALYLSCYQQILS